MSALARDTDPGTAHQAAFQFDAVAASIEQRIVDRLRTGGMTSHAIAAVLNLDLVTVSPRLRPLVTKGFVRDSGRRAESPSGRARIIWELVP